MNPYDRHDIGIEEETASLTKAQWWEVAAELNLAAHRYHPETDGPHKLLEADRMDEIRCRILRQTGVRDTPEEELEGSEPPGESHT